LSYDLEIVVHGKPERDDIEQLLSARPGFSLAGKFESGEGNLLVSRRARKTEQPAFTVDGPFAVEVDDLPEKSAAAVLAPRWLIQVSVPAGAAGKDLAAARALARHLASRCNGAVYDPQEDAVIWPKGKRRRYRAPLEEQRIRVVGLAWFCPPTENGRGAAEMLLACARRHFPEIVPQRFGTFEPLQGRLGQGNDGPFLAAWHTESQRECAGSLFWKSTAPCFGGSVVFPDRRKNPPERLCPKGGQPAVSVKVSLDGRALDADGRWRDAAVSVFLDVARKLGAFYAGGIVERDVIARRGLWYDGRSENLSLGGPWWCGLPETHTWLAWFGNPYRPYVGTVLPDTESPLTLPYPPGSPAIARDLEEGLLLQVGKEPRDTDQLRGAFPRLPAELLAREEADDGIGGTKRRTPAKVIPQLYHR
jgi:hypothetical protein